MYPTYELVIAILKHCSSKFKMLFIKENCYALWVYIRAHSNLPGPLTEGNALADKFTHLIALSKIRLAQW